MHRPTLGIIALVLIVAAIALRLWPQSWGAYEALLGACTRVGLVMGALWLAQPQVARLPSWTFDAILVTGVIVAVRPKLILIAVPLAFAIWLLRPRK